MTVFALALKSPHGRLVTSALTASSVALGVTLVLSTFLLTRDIKEEFIQGTTDFSLIVGAKGSSTELLLNVIFRIDVPPPNTAYTLYEQLQAERGQSRLEVRRSSCQDSCGRCAARHC